MKILNFINLTIIVVLLLSGIIGINDKEYLVKTFVIGLLLLPSTQLIIGIIWLVFYPEKKRILQYFYGVTIFISLLFITSLIFKNINKNEILEGIWIGFFGSIPIVLALYFSYILNKYAKTFSFLTAEWNDLALINYQIDPKILEKHVPKGTELDLWNNKCFISLIGFMFEDVQVLGVKVPYHVNFEEVNLRFYVKRFENGIWKRGAVFIKEIVPKHAITIVANTLYKEHYQTLPMRHSRTANEISKSFRYEWKKDNKWNFISISTAKNAIAIEKDSEAEFITEHYFGYTKYNEKKSIEYEVSHPRWNQLQVIAYEIDVNFENIYGIEFAFLHDLKPVSAFLAIGSKISIEGKKTIK